MKSLVLLFLSILVIVKGEEEMCSTSCGPIGNIRYPFRLKGDPSYCGDKDYELTCENNNTFLHVFYASYLVKRISYEDATINIVSYGLLSDNCVDFSSVSADSENTSFGSPAYESPYNWATFVTCSKEIRNDWYMPVSCLTRNNSFGYVLNDYSIGSILPNCTFVSMCGTSYNVTSGLPKDKDIFQVLQEGFDIAWLSKHHDVHVGIFKVIHYCGKTATTTYAKQYKGRKNILTRFIYPFQIGVQTLNCLNERTYTDGSGRDYYYLFSRFCIKLIIVIDIAAVISAIALLVRFILVPLVFYVFLAHNIWKSLVPINNVEKFLRMLETITPTRYSYTEIIAMTGHFKEKLGQGGFGAVFKGELPGGLLVAIKILSSSKGNGDDFISEVSTIGSIHHHNVVRLVGFCSEGQKRALVYEFMPKGSLDKYIFSSNVTNMNFTKKKLNEIALGVARGIDYLHRGCDMRILHFDIKPHNILLDHNFNPKVSDFGLAKLYPKNYSLVSTFAARGTIGYMAPELVSRSFGQISYKSDVYSFGMLLMEMAGGRRNVESHAENSSQVYYPSWIYDQIQEKERQQILNNNEIGVDDIETKLCKVGLWCIQMRPSDRPDMSRVIEMLEADTETLPLPPKPFSSSSVPTSLRESLVDSHITELSTISESTDPPSLD